MSEIDKATLDRARAAAIAELHRAETETQAWFQGTPDSIRLDDNFNPVGEPFYEVNYDGKFDLDRLIKGNCRSNRLPTASRPIGDGDFVATKGDVTMAEVWIIGRKATLPNGHEYITEPFIAFESNVDAQAACDMVAKVSGERPGIASGALYRVGETARPID